MYFTRKIECISAAYGISRNVSSKLSRSTNHPLHGHNFSNSDLYTFACKRKAPLLYLPASPKQILNRRNLKRRSSPPCVRLGSPPGLNLFLQPAHRAGFLLSSFRARNRARVSRATTARLRAQSSPLRRPTSRPSTLARARPSPSARRHATSLTHFHRFPLVFAPHATSHPKSL